MMYKVAQPNSQAPVYDAQHFSSRQTAAMQMMPPDVATAYFGADAAANPSASVLQQPAHGASSPAGVYQQSPSMNSASTMPGVSAVQQAAASADVSINEDTDTNNEFPDDALEEKWLSYQRQLGSVFQDISSESLENASETLLTISNFLLSQVVDLGLTLDDSSLNADRLKLWNDFNHAWLALGSQQKNLAESGRQLSRTSRLMSQATVEKLGSELVRLCDGLEHYGLVDYQYGVWEDQIIAVLEECLDLFESKDRADASIQKRHDSSPHSEYGNWGRFIFQPASNPMAPVSNPQQVETPRPQPAAPPPPPQKKARRILSTEEKLKIYLYNKENPSAKQTEISTRFGVDSSTVSKILKHYLERGGCYNCERKHINCQKAKPECEHCVKTGSKCEYPSPPQITKNIAISVRDVDGKFSCPHTRCIKKYTRAANLKRHLLQHTSDRPHKCMSCGTGFVRCDVLRRHSKKCPDRVRDAPIPSHLSHPDSRVRSKAQQLPVPSDKEFSQNCGPVLTQSETGGTRGLVENGRPTQSRVDFTSFNSTSPGRLWTTTTWYRME